MSRTALTQHFRSRYGASPVHLVGHAVALGIAVFALDQIVSGGGLAELIALYIGFVILHDLVLLPAYSFLDRVVRGGLTRVPRRWSAGVPAINHVRAPLVISGVLLLIYLPLISGRAAAGYFSVTGHRPEGYLRNWLLITAGLFAASGLIYASRVLGARARAGAAEAGDAGAEVGGAAARSLDKQI